MNGCMKTYTVEKYAAILFGYDNAEDVPASKVQWLVRRLRRGELPGFKAGREWVATEADVEAAIEKLRPKTAIPAVPAMSGLTRTSARRLAAS